MVNWTDDHSRQIEALIELIPDGQAYHDFDSWPQPNFRQLNVLPVMFDIGGASVLCPDGTWKCVLWNEPHAVTEMACFDDRIERGLRHKASQKYPSLQWMKPIPQSVSINCPECNGDGISPAAKAGATNVVCWCGGLGWVPANEPKP